MSADSAYNFALPCALFNPVNASIKFVERYRRFSKGFALVLSAAASSALALVSGTLGGFAAMYLYDRGMGRGNDFAVSLGGFFAVGTFAFVVMFTWLQKTHHPVSSRTPLFALYACLILPAVVTASNADEMDYYSIFMLGDWLAILVLGLLSLLVCRRWWRDEEQGF